MNLKFFGLLGFRHKFNFLISQGISFFFFFLPRSASFQSNMYVVFCGRFQAVTLNTDSMLIENQCLFFAVNVLDYCITF